MARAKAKATPKAKAKAKPAKAKAKAKPAKAKAKPAEAKAKPAEAKAKPAKAKAKPAKAKAKPRNSASSPTSAKAKPAEAKAKPAEAKAKPAQARARAPSPISPAKTKAEENRAPSPISAKGDAKPPSAKPAKVRASAPSTISGGEAVPTTIATETSTEAHRRLFTARDRAIRSSPVVEILDDPDPISALRRFLDSLKGEATQQQAQIALGSAQLILLPLERDQRGGAEVKELVDLIVRHWLDFGERRKGFHAQEFLKHAFAALGVDRTRVARLERLIPDNANSDLWFNLATSYAAARDKVAMLRAVDRALDRGASPGELRRHPDFLPYANDSDLQVLLARAELPPIPVDIAPYLPGVRGALDSLLATLKEFGESVELRPPVRLEAVLDSERAAKISLPNDYRALLTITNGMRLWEHEFFSAGDYREQTKLATRAQQYLASNLGATGLIECVPIASWGQPTDWLLYDPRGRMRAGAPGYVLMLDADGVAVEDLATALAHMENMAREVLGTN